MSQPTIPGRTTRREAAVSGGSDHQDAGRHRRHVLQLDQEVLARAHGERRRGATLFGARLRAPPAAGLHKKGGAAAGLHQEVGAAVGLGEEGRGRFRDARGGACGRHCAAPAGHVRRRRQGKGHQVYAAAGRGQAGGGASANNACHAAGRHDHGVAERVADGDQRRARCGSTKRATGATATASRSRRSSRSPFACIVFVLVGAPIALRFPRGGVGLVIGVELPRLRDLLHRADRRRVAREQEHRLAVLGDVDRQHRVPARRPACSSRGWATRTRRRAADSSAERVDAVARVVPARGRGAHAPARCASSARSTGTSSASSGRSSSSRRSGFPILLVRHRPHRSPRDVSQPPRSRRADIALSYLSTGFPIRCSWCCRPRCCSRRCSRSARSRATPRSRRRRRRASASIA